MTTRLDKLQNEARYRLAICANVLVDSNGLSPTPNQLRKVMESIRIYYDMTGSDLAYHIDVAVLGMSWTL